jgi:AraC-like DNA-binding protein
MAPRKKRTYGISSWITRAVLQELEARGVPADALLKRHRLNRSDILDPDGWVPLTSHRAFYRDATAASGDPTFQVKVGRRVPVHVTRAAGYCAAVSSTLGEAMDAFGRFSELLVDGSRISGMRTAQRDVVYARRPELFPLPEDGPSFAVAVLDFFRHATGRPVKATRLMMTGSTLVPPEALESEIGAPITWNAADFEVHFPPGTLDTPVLHADPKLKESLEVAALRALSRAGGSRTQPVSTLVREALRESGFGPNLSKTSMARALGMSARTLQRRLAGESLTYAQVLDETRRAAAMPLLRDAGLTSVEVALRLGFSSRTAFLRAVKRWTGKTPGELRAKSSKRKSR